MRFSRLYKNKKKKRILAKGEIKNVPASVKMLTRLKRECLLFSYFPPNISPSTYKRTISCLAFERMVMDFLKCPGNLPSPS